MDVNMCTDMAWLCTKKELWEASPTANLTYNTTDCEAHSGIEVRDLSHKVFRCKADMAYISLAV
jgi:hypothetical protein